MWLKITENHTQSQCFCRDQQLLPWWWNLRFWICNHIQYLWNILPLFHYPQQGLLHHLCQQREQGRKVQKQRWRTNKKKHLIFLKTFFGTTYFHFIAMIFVRTWKKNWWNTKLFQAFYSKIFAKNMFLN